MNGNLLDTNVIVGALRGDDAAIDFLESLDDVFTSVVVIGELLYGANKSSKTVQNIAIIRKLTEGINILSVDEETAVIYADIKNEVMKTGFTLPENDLWIAASAKQNDLVLVTFDKHFSYIKSIKMIGA